MSISAAIDLAWPIYPVLVLRALSYKDPPGPPKLVALERELFVSSGGSIIIGTCFPLFYFNTSAFSLRDI